MRFRWGRSQLREFIESIGIVTLILSMIIPSSTLWAGEIFTRASHEPCPQYLDKSSSLPQACRGSQLDSVCHAVDGLDKATAQAFTGSIVYGLAAVTCTAGCAGVPWAIPACTVAGLVASLTDIGYMIAWATMGNDYTESATSGRDQVWSGLDGAGTSLTAATSIGIGIAQLTMKSTAQVAEEAARESIRLQGEVNSNQTLGTQARVERMDQIRNAEKAKVDQHNAAKQKMACALMAFTGAMTVFKSINTGIFAKQAEKEELKIDPLISEVGPSCFPVPQSQANTPRRVAQNITAPPTSTGGGSGSIGGGTSSASSPSTSSNSSGNNLPPMNLAALTSAAKSDMGTGLGKHMGEFLEQAVPELEKHYGVTPQDIAQAVASGQSLPSVLGQMVPAAEKALNTIAENKDEFSKEFKFTNSDSPNQLAYTNASSSGGGAAGAANPLGGLDMGALFGKKPGEAGTLSGVSEVQFGAKEAANSTDIWHTGTKKSIFEIVSDKWTAVVKRFIREDGERPNSLARDVPTQTGAPGLTRTPASATAPQSLGTH